jgi:hypothetical protein
VSLTGVGRISEVTGWGHRAAVLDDQGLLYIIDGSTTDNTIAPSLSGLCEDEIASVALSADEAVVACITTREVWVTPLTPPVR